MNERVLSGQFKKVYNKNDVRNWIKFGIDLKVIDKNDRKGIMNWIKLLDTKTINIQTNDTNIFKQKTTFKLFRNQYW